ncbi:hypothetical protein BJX70DRAFT_402558 [Aspergillus crustosus]
MENLIHRPSTLQMHGYLTGPSTVSFKTTPKTTEIVALQLRQTFSNLFSLAAIDAQTGKILFDRVYDTEIPGTGIIDLTECTNEARRDLFKYVNRDTILVVYDAAQKLKVLNIVHERIVDVRVVAHEAVVAKFGVRKISFFPSLSQLSRDVAGVELRCTELEEARAIQGVANRFAEEGVLEGWVKRQRRVKTPA